MRQIKLNRANTTLTFRREVPLKKLRLVGETKVMGGFIYRVMQRTAQCSDNGKGNFFNEQVNWEIIGMSKEDLQRGVRQLKL